MLCYNPLTNAVYPPPPCYPYQQPAVAGSNPVGHTIEIPTPTGMGISQSVEKAALPLLIDMHETIVAERCERFRYYCIVGCQNDKRRVETSGGATGVGGTNTGMPQQRSLRKRMVPAAGCYNNTPGKFLRHPSFFCGSSNPAK